MFDRIGRKLETRDLMSNLHVRAMQLTHRALAPLGYPGISRVHAAINRLMRLGSDTLILENESRFIYPSDDYYWNRLLDADWLYEPEIDALLHGARALPFVFVDLGANFGYWSARVGSGMYGEHSTIAVEASAANLPLLKRNTSGLLYPVSVHHRAVDSISGRRLHLYGGRHAGRSICKDWHGASNEEGDEVTTISVDDLLTLEKVDARHTPVLVKLDVEGAEDRAVQGASNTLAGQSALIIEDAEKHGVSGAVRRLFMDRTITLYKFDNDCFKTIRNLDEIMDMKARHWSFQSCGLNLVATASLIWKKAILPSADH